ncbi:MAG: methyltransferase domain-containing protein [Proteobacteria bacterium]|nr:methyltransferase domain-containing protein [Pseudomonadota bacterium]
MMNRKKHWDTVYAAKASDQLSWYQETPVTSLDLIDQTGVAREDAIIDVGGGASVLVDHLLALGYTDLTVLDISGRALRAARRRLSGKADQVCWIESDITMLEPQRQYALWHDRAVFHFLTAPADRAKYVALLKNSLATDGFLVIGAFAVDGPARCSGLDVVRYDRQGICAELGACFRLLGEFADPHKTPWGAEQKFAFFSFRYLGNDDRH